MQTSLGYIYSDSYLLGVNLLKEAAGRWVGGVEGGVELRKDEQKNEDKLSGIIKQSKVSTRSGENRCPSFKIL